MKNLSFVIVQLSVLLVSCKKSMVDPKPLASLRVINAIVGSASVVKFNDNFRDSVRVYNAGIFRIVPGESVALYPSSNPTTPYYFNDKPNTENGKLYSIFLCGQAQNVETLFKEESYPSRYNDSIIGIRVINLSPNSTPINITLQNNPGVNVFSDLEYKELSNFVTLPLPTTIPSGSVSFQVRSADNPGSVLATYTLPTSANSLYPNISVTLQRFKNITLVIKGLKGTTGNNPDAFGIFPVLTTY